MSYEVVNKETHSSLRLTSFKMLFVIPTLEFMPQQPANVIQKKIVLFFQRLSGNETASNGLYWLLCSAQTSKDQLLSMRTAALANVDAHAGACHICFALISAIKVRVKECIFNKQVDVLLLREINTRDNHPHYPWLKYAALLNAHWECGKKYLNMEKV